VITCFFNAEEASKLGTKLADNVHLVPLAVLGAGAGSSGWDEA
jgi:hypothetical protein